MSGGRLGYVKGWVGWGKSEEETEQDKLELEQKRLALEQELREKFKEDEEKMKEDFNKGMSGGTAFDDIKIDNVDPSYIRFLFEIIIP
jgi:hypothetical protein